MHSQQIREEDEERKNQCPRDGSGNKKGTKPRSIPPAWKGPLQQTCVLFWTKTLLLVFWKLSYYLRKERPSKCQCNCEGSQERTGSRCISPRSCKAPSTFISSWPTNQPSRCQCKCCCSWPSSLDKHEYVLLIYFSCFMPILQLTLLYSRCTYIKIIPNTVMIQTKPTEWRIGWAGWIQAEEKP